VGNVPILSQFLIVLSTLIFVGTGGHAMLLGLALESFRWLPIGQSILNQDTYGLVIRWSSMIFLGGLLMALPVMVSLLFINVGLGVVTRAAPSLNIFAVGFPAMVIAGFIVLMLSMDSIGGRIEWLWVHGGAKWLTNPPDRIAPKSQQPESCARLAKTGRSHARPNCLQPLL
jgi:flagellar biosynthetic protein FliR